MQRECKALSQASAARHSWSCSRIATSSKVVCMYAASQLLCAVLLLLPLLLQVRLMAAEAALSAGEVGIATHLCLQLAAVRYAPAWHLAAELACPQR